MSEYVRITDVAPRDGLQNEPGVIPTDGKARLVRALLRAGVDEVEVSSFVSPKWVPQLGDAAELFGLLADSKPDSMCYSALVPNERGMTAALEVNERARAAHDVDRLIDKVSVFTAASETFSMKNTNASIAETIRRFRPVVDTARREGLAVRAYVSCVVACPFEGAIAPARVASVTERLLELGVDEIDLGDTIGEATPESIRAMLERSLPLLNGTDAEPVLHLHDTHGRARACVREALALGVRSFDGAAGGLGGCPYASTPQKRAPGNIDTSTVVRAARGAGHDTGVDLEALDAASVLARELTSGALP